jgi:pyrroline-5-carboxylate reductase
MSAVTGTIAGHVEYVAAIAGWLARQGIPANEASAYVASLFAGIAGTLAEPATDDLRALARANATPGGINEQFAALLTQGGAYALVERSLDALLERLRADAAHGRTTTSRRR